MSQVWNGVENKISGQVYCVDSTISSKKWIETLVQLDEVVMITPNTSNDIFCISLPFCIDDIRQVLHENEYIDDIFMDTIIDFLAPNKRFMENNIISQNDESKEAFILNNNDPETEFKHFDVSKYNELLSTQAIIIINIKDNSYVSIPRNVKHLSQWYISWFGVADNVTIYNAVSDKIQSSLPKNFKVDKHWGKKTTTIRISDTEKLMLSEWHFNGSDNKTHSVVLLHSITFIGKSRRKLWVDNTEKYDNESSTKSFRIEIDKDIVTVNIDHDTQTDIYSYKLVINNDTFQNKLKESRKKTVIPIGHRKKKIDIGKIYGKIQFVNNSADYKVEVVNHFADLKVQKVNHFPNSTGKWQVVKHFPDYKIQIVKHSGDFKIQYVNNFPGVVKK